MKAFILSARRTPIGSFLGAFKDFSAVDLGVAAAAPLWDESSGSDVADVIVGNVLQAGHPIEASGARVVVTLAHALRRVNREFGVASLRIGGGMGIAVVLRTL